jgi:hypothetical protein
MWKSILSLPFLVTLRWKLESRRRDWNIVLDNNIKEKKEKLIIILFPILCSLVRIDLSDKSVCFETKAQLHIALWFSIDSAPLAITFLAKNTTVNWIIELLAYKVQNQIIARIALPQI